MDAPLLFLLYLNKLLQILHEYNKAGNLEIGVHSDLLMHPHSQAEHKT